MKKKIILSVSALVLIVVIVLGVLKYIDVQRQHEEKRLRLEQEYTANVVALNLVMDGIELFYEDYIELQSENTNYYEAMAESTINSELLDKWDAIENAEMRDLRYMITDFNEVFIDCSNDLKCKEDDVLQPLLKNIRRHFDTHEQALLAWQNGFTYEGNELFSSLNESSQDVIADIRIIKNDYIDYINSDMQDMISKFDDTAVFAIGLDRYLEQKGYCTNIDPMFHSYARYENLCATANESSYIEVYPMQSFFYEEPILFNGAVSSNTVKITITAKGTGYTDKNYELSSFTPGDTTFTYRAKEEFYNLTFGENTYYFVAHFDDGTTSTDEVTINYYGGGY